MKKIIAAGLVAVGLTVWLTSSAQLSQLEYKTLEKLMANHEPVSVTSDANGVYITLVKGAEIYQCAISPYVDANNPSSFRPGYNISCDLMKEARNDLP